MDEPGGQLMGVQVLGFELGVGVAYPLSDSKKSLSLS